MVLFPVRAADGDKEKDMKPGMLWFDNSETQLTVKVQKAVDYYKKKYRVDPNLCLVHPSMLGGLTHEGNQIEVNGVTVRPYRPVLPGHLWLGVEDA